MFCSRLSYQSFVAQSARRRTPTRRARCTVGSNPTGELCQNFLRFFLSFLIASQLRMTQYAYEYPLAKTLIFVSNDRKIPCRVIMTMLQKSSTISRTITIWFLLMGNLAMHDHGIRLIKVCQSFFRENSSAIFEAFCKFPTIGDRPKQKTCYMTTGIVVLWLSWHD